MFNRRADLVAGVNESLFPDCVSIIIPCNPPSEPICVLISWRICPESRFMILIFMFTFIPPGKGMLIRPVQTMVLAFWIIAQTSANATLLCISGPRITYAAIKRRQHAAKVVIDLKGFFITIFLIICNRDKGWL